MTTKNIISALSCLWLILFLYSCNEDNNITPENLRIGFLKSGIDVGENTGILKVPLTVEGVSEYRNFDFSVGINSKDQTARKDTDYKFSDQTIRINRSGEYFIEVEILDNKEIETKERTFILFIGQTTEGIVKKISEVEIRIVNDDSPEMTLAGNYTLMASDYIKGGSPWSSAKGKVLIEADASVSGKYWMRNLELESDAGILPLTLEEGIYFTVDESGNTSIPSTQNIGDYGQGKGMLVGIKGADGTVSEENIPLTISNNSIYWDSEGIAAIVPSDQGIKAVYYALRNVILKKTK